MILDYRGATGFDLAANPNALNLARDAAQLDPYGTVLNRSTTPPKAIGVNYVTGGEDWLSSIGDIDGARYVQIRFSFINNVEAGVNAELSAVGLAYLEQ